MAVIGEANITGMAGSSITSATLHFLMQESAQTYTAAANQEVFKVWFYCGTSYTGDGSGVDVGVYDITGGVSGATLVTSGQIATMSADSWNSATITPVALTQGNIYAVALRCRSATNIAAFRIYNASAISRSNLTGSSALAASWTNNSTAGFVYGVYAETRTTSTLTAFPWIRA